ncbi:MAG: hypothetical protein M3O94_04865 [Actinomycetota bacterium]|nr:hypothetical protein [Actinomycetota bacterium]
MAAVVGGLGLVMAVATPAAVAGGNGAQTFTQHDRNVTKVKDPAHFPCLKGVLGARTLVYSDVFHGTINKNGSWFTGTVHGTVSFVPTDPALPTYAGHFTTWFGDENNRKNEVEHSTFSVEAKGSDGSKVTFHDTAHASTNANGVVTVTFDKARCG